MRPDLILQPMGALVALTFFVLLLIPFHRVRAARAGHVSAVDFKLGESSRVPADVAIPNRNYMNLLELPMLFYVVCTLFYVTASAGTLTLSLAWTYVILRVLHSAVHLTYNNVLHRLSLFAASNFILGTMWVVFFLKLDL